MPQDRRPSNYRLFLRETIKSRGVSLTEFARQIEVSPAFISQVLNKRRGLSEERATSIATFLGLNDSEAKHFTTLVRYENAKSVKFRTLLRRELDSLNESNGNANQVAQIQADTFVAISTWYHCAILELTELADHTLNVEWIAKKLKILPMEADTALRRLIRLGLLTRHGTSYQKTHNNFVAGYVSSKAVRHYHKQMMNLAAKALDEQPYEKRDVRGTTFAMRREQLPDIQKLLDTIFNSVRQRDRASKPSELYHLSAQLFRLDHNV